MKQTDTKPVLWHSNELSLALVDGATRNFLHNFTQLNHKFFFKFPQLRKNHAQNLTMVYGLVFIYSSLSDSMVFLISFLVVTSALAVHANIATLPFTARANEYIKHI